MSFFALSALINFFTSSALVFFLTIKKSKFIYYIFYNLSIAFWSINYFFWQISTNQSLALLFCRLLTIGSGFIPYFFIIFIVNFIGYKEKKWYKFFSLYNNLAIFFFLSASFSPLLVLKVTSTLGFLFWPEAGILYPIFLLYFFLNIIFALILLFSKLKDIRIRYILLASLIGYLGGATNFPLWFNIPIAPFGNILVSVYIVIVAYAITKYELMDITVVIKRWLARLIVFALIVTSFVVTILVLDYNNTLLAIALSILGLFWAYATYPAIRILITTKARKFLKGWYEPEDVLTAISKKLEKEKSRRKIFSIIAKELYNALEIEQMALLVARKNEKRELTHYILFDKNLTEHARLELNNIVIEFITKNSKMINLKNLIKGLKESYSEEEVGLAINKLKELGFSGKEVYFLPFISPEILEGIIIINEKTEGKPFREKDLVLFDLVIRQMENLFYKLTPYEKIEKQFELNQKKLYETQVQLVRAEKIASLARIIQNSNHELRTPMHTINMAAFNIANEAQPSVEHMQRFIHTVNMQSQRALSVIENSLELSSTKKRTPELLNLNKIIDEAIILVPRSTAEIIKKLDSVPEIMGIKSELISVVINFINNAGVAMPNGGSITISTNYEPETKEVILKIADTGTGIPAENMEKIWEPYFTTNATDGHGLGLSIVHQIVLNHKAHISVESEINNGTTFTIRFPV
ncbi:MAG: ATP-binding protein [Candidatus Margulisiibacteriota bacterium]|jgi:two-component system nitrogen regulation sensor histidine kinase GlnL